MSYRKDPQGFEVRVTYLGGGNGYGIRVIRDGKIWRETRVDSKGDIAAAIKSELRWIDKGGSPSDMASASRDRWYKKWLRRMGML